MAQIGLKEVATVTDNYFRSKDPWPSFCLLEFKSNTYLDNIKNFYFEQLCILIDVFFILKYQEESYRLLPVLKNGF